MEVISQEPEGGLTIEDDTLCRIICHRNMLLKGIIWVVGSKGKQHVNSLLNIFCEDFGLVPTQRMMICR